MNIKKIASTTGQYLFLALFLCLLAAIPYAAELLRRWSS